MLTDHTQFSGLQVGESNGAEINRISTATASIDLASIANGGNSSATAALAGAVAGCTVIGNPGSNWSGTYNVLSLAYGCETDGVVTVKAGNPSSTTINPDASTFRFTAIVY